MTPRWRGLAMALLTLALDQGNKLWLIDVFDIAEHQPVAVAPFLDVVFARNPGISYSLFSAHTALGRWGLVAFTFAATAALAVWLWRSTTILVCLALGLVVGGALGNAIDRLLYGWVADFYYFHVGSFHWYIFNLADVAIVAGVAILLFESLVLAPGRPAAASR